MALHLWTAGLAAAWLAARLGAGLAPYALRGAGQRPAWDEPWARILASAALLGAAVLLNAAVCGMISGPFPRYQARVAWLLPVAVALVELGRLSLRRTGASQA